MTKIETAVLRSVSRISGLSLAMFVAAMPVQAGLLGNSISGEFNFPDATTVYGGFTYSVNPFIVGAGVESVLTIDGLITTNVDFSDTALVLTMTTDAGFSPTSFAGPQFSVLSGNPFGSIASVVVPGGQLVTAAIVSDELQVNWQDQTFTIGDTITVNFRDTAAAVPEPDSLAMFGLGAIGLVAGAIRRRRQTKTAI